MHRVLAAIHESVIVLQQMFSEHKHAFPEAPKRHFESPEYSTLLLHSVWTAFFDRCLIKLPTGEYVSPQYGGSRRLDILELGSILKRPCLSNFPDGTDKAWEGLRKKVLLISCRCVLHLYKRTTKVDVVIAMLLVLLSTPPSVC